MTPLLDLVIDRKLKNQILHHRLNAHWAGSFFMEALKIYSGAWPTDKLTPDGHQIFQVPTIDVAVSRATELTEMAIVTMVAKGWAIEAPPAEEIMDDGGKAGFVTTSD